MPAAWRSSIVPLKATPSASLRRPEGFLPPPPQTAGHHVDTPDTTHLSVVDAKGNAVALTTTINNDYGSGVTAGSLGFLLNDEMDDFASKAGTPNFYGLIQGPADAIAPGKRPLSAMTPTIVLEKGKLRFVLGSPGGARIITTVANIFLSAAEGGLNIQEAVDAPRFHHQYLPDKLYLEPGFPQQTIDRATHHGLHQWMSRMGIGRRGNVSKWIGRPGSFWAGRIIAAITVRWRDTKGSEQWAANSAGQPVMSSWLLLETGGAAVTLDPGTWPSGRNSENTVPEA